MPLLVVDLKSIQNKLIENPWDFKTIEERITNFVYYGKKSGYVIEIISRSQYIKDLQFWKDKTLQTLQLDEQSLRNSPNNLDYLIEDFFRSSGIKVFYSTNTSRIEALASYASTKKALILSSSKKIAQSREYDYTLFRDFDLDDERQELNLTKRLDDGEFKHKINIRLNKKLSLSEKWEADYLPLKSQKERSYCRGGLEFLQLYENPHIVIRHLRQALYHFLGLKEVVIEVFPMFEKEKYVWNEQKVQGDEKYNDLLFQPEFAIDYFFPDLCDAHKRLCDEDLKFYFYNVLSITLEMCSVAMDKPPLELIRNCLPRFFKGCKLEDFITKEHYSFPEKKEKEKKEEIKQENEEEINEKIVSVGGKNLICKTCKKNFFITDRDCEIWKSKNMVLPKRCSKCRYIRRNEKMFSPKKEERPNIKEKVNELYRKGEETKQLFKKMNKKDKFNVLMDL